MGLDMLILLAACLLALAVIAVRLTPKTKQGSTKPTRHKEAPVDSEKMELFYIAHVPAEMRKLEGGGFEASAKAQTELLEAGFTVLRKLPTDIRDCLNCPVAPSLTALLSQGEDLSTLTAERVRAAVVVAEASLALWDLMFEFEKRVSPPHPVALGEPIGVLVAGKQVFRVSYVIEHMSRGAGVSLAVAFAMWEAMVEILREGFVSIPGIRAAQPPVETSGEE